MPERFLDEQFDDSLTPAPGGPIDGEYGRDALERMEKDKPFVLDDTKPIYPAETVGLASRDYDGSEISVVAEIGVKAPENGGLLRAVVIKQTYADGMAAYRVRGLGEPYAAYDGKIRRRVLDVTEDTPSLAISYTPQVLGRNLAEGNGRTPAEDIWGAGRMQDAKKMSRLHIEVREEAGKVILVDHSTNGSYIQAHEGEAPTHRAIHTRKAMENAERKGLIVDGKYLGARGKYGVIGRNTPVTDGMVDLRSQVAGREALVVDSTDETYAAHYDKLRKDFRVQLNKLRGKDGGYSEKDALEAVYKTTLSAMDYDLGHVNKLSDKLRVQQGGIHEVNVGQYLKDGKGVCRQMALVSAWLANDAVKRGILKGVATTGVNSNIKEHSGHEWARYTTNTGEVYIIDPAQKFFGTLGESLQQEQKGEAIWEYFRPGEKEKYLAELELKDKGRARTLRALGSKALRKLLYR